MQGNEDKLSKVGGTRRSNHYPYVATTVKWQKATGSEVLGWDDLPQLVTPYRSSFKAFLKKTSSLHALSGKAGKVGLANASLQRKNGNL